MNQIHRSAGHMCCLLFMLGVACMKTDESQIVARVGQAVLTLQEVEEGTPGIGTLAAKAQSELFIQRWIESELLYQEALRRNIDQHVEVQRALKKMAREYIITSFLEGAVNDTSSISDAEIQSYYQDQKDEFQTPEDLYHLEIILVQSYQEALQLRRQLANGAPFAEIARRHSIDGSRSQGGDLGFLPARNLSPILARTAAILRPGQLSDPIKSEVGYNLMQLVEVQRKGSVTPLERVRPLIQQRILAQKKEDNYQTLISQLSREATLYTDLTKLRTNKEKE